MDYSIIIRYVFVAIISLIVTGILKNALGNRNLLVKEGNSILTMPKLYLYISYILSLGFFLYEYVALIKNEMNLTWQLRIIYGLFGLFLFFGSFKTLLLYKKHKIIYNNEWIKQINWLGKEKTIKWNDIIKVSFSSLSSSLKIETKNDKILIHQHIKGFKTISKQLKSRKTG